MDFRQSCGALSGTAILNCVFLYADLLEDSSDRQWSFAPSFSLLEALHDQFHCIIEHSTFSFKLIQAQAKYTVLFSCGSFAVIAVAICVANN